ncbi:hypothetical protein CEUSTIGMA_g6226.t1 [Chlamydomonas eustigma]|uniref:Nascent polypeptide-associated complex subunit alpha-like UBA domain-containing protein n=1 Tax=Chlamydomonas eustigma TaxID=1157962 RepID=A0A250X798_9CHLO|nr:hypothetical protein CEUSTIGMA_g6226.t1 [Chlamydomonas eustigma]|eukprot:GAX78789.1 hypothetical protein CEUSTIGMA_g6226.t1 [Chlamydomonas eustigma]
MALEEGDDVEVPEESKDAKDKQRAEQHKAMDSMTDLVPEKQLDEAKVQKAMTDLATSQRASKEAMQLREKELAAVKINKEEVDIITSEFEMDKKSAERRLREHGGNLHAALASLL